MAIFPPSPEYIDFKTTGADRNGHFGCIEECINAAVNCGGRIFGGFLRDVIYPLNVGRPLSELKFKDIDIWFKNDVQVKAFREKMVNSLKELTPDTNRDQWYKFSRTSFVLRDKGIPITWVDVVLSDVLPVDDFDVNGLCYGGHTLTGPQWSVGDTCNPDVVSKMLEHLGQRKMTMLDSYVVRLAADNTASEIASDRLRKFLRQGWTITATGESGKDVRVVDDTPSVVITPLGWRIKDSSQSTKLLAPHQTIQDHTEKSGTGNAKSAVLGDMLVINLALLSEVQKTSLMAVIALCDH